MARTLPCIIGLLLTVAAAAAPVTFHKQIEPIVQKHCQGCHRPGEAAPFSMMSYRDLRPWAKAIKEAVALRKMPPWFADPAHGRFANERRLSPAEIATIRSWVDQGAPEGDAADAPPPLKFPDDWKIGQPDLVFELPTDYSVPPDGKIDYIWFASSQIVKEDLWIEKLEVRPGDRKVVHHALVFARAPGSSYRPTLQPGGSFSRPEIRRSDNKPQNDAGSFGIGNGFQAGLEMIGDYVPNGDPFIAAPDQARFVPAGSHLLFQMHYTANGRPTKDRTKVGIVLAKKPPKFRIINDAVVNASIRIPPGAPNHQVVANAKFQHDTQIGGFGPHMHVRGKAMRYDLVRASGAVETLLDVKAYDFNWQLKYQPAAFVRVAKGDQLRVTAWYDNSPNNPHNPDATKEVRWGDQSWDEMLFAFFDYVIPAGLNPDLVTGGRPQERAANQSRK